jgi:hypothetical protein
VKRRTSLLAGVVAGASAWVALRRWMHTRHCQPFEGSGREHAHDQAASQAPANNSTAAITPRKRLAVRVLSVLALPAALYAIYVGGLDIALGAVLGQRLLGAVFLACGLALFIAVGVGLFSKSLWPSSFTFLLLVGAVPGIITFVLQALAFRYNVVLLTWAGMALIPLAVIATIWSSGDRSGGLKHVNAILSAGVVVTALTVGQTVYSTSYSPIRRGESLTVLTKISPIAARTTPKLGLVRAFRAEVTLENVGDAKLMYLGGVYSIVGYRAAFRSGQEQKAWPSKLPAELASQQWSARYQKKEDLSLIEGGYDLFRSGDWIAPGTKVMTDWIIYVKDDSYDGLIFNVAVGTARADRMELIFPANPDHAEISGRVHSEWRVRETSLLNQLTRGTRYVTVIYRSGSAEGQLDPMTMEAFVDSEETRSQTLSEYNDRLNASYGVTQFGAIVYGDNWKKK